MFFIYVSKYAQEKILQIPKKRSCNFTFKMAKLNINF